MEKSYEERKQEVEELRQLFKEITSSGGVMRISYYDFITISPAELRKRVDEGECP